jgi:hypothetical protein
MSSPRGTHPVPAGHPDGSTGQHGSFLDECRDLADPRRVGQRGVDGVNKPVQACQESVVGPSDPVLARERWVNKSPLKQEQTIPSTRELAEEREEDAYEVYLERLAIADDLGMDTGPGSHADITARREADRVLSGVPFFWTRSRGPDAIDITLRAFAPAFGGLKFVRFEGRST